MNLDRREAILFGLGVAATSATSLNFLNPAHAQNVTIDRIVQNLNVEVESVLSQARRIGVLPNNANQLRAPESANAALDLAEIIQKAIEKAQAGDDQAKGLADLAGGVLSKLNSFTREVEIGEARASFNAPPPSYADTHDEYRKLFQSCKIAASHRLELVRAARIITSTDAYKRYKDVETLTNVPWYVIGALHYREASLNFMGHLHNGDYLKEKTKQVPKDRPPGQWPPVPWDPISAWRDSAVDALQKYKSVASWNVERMLYTFEGYNGWGYRSHPGFRSPYLWNYTQYYSKGGYPCDHCWSDNYVSKQAGLVAVIKTVVDLAAADKPLNLIYA